MSTIRRTRHVATALAAVLVLGAAACGRTGGSGSGGGEAAESRGGGASSSGSSGSGKADFASLTNVCQPGDAKGATAQGVTDTEIKVGTITDFGFTQNPEFIKAAEVFTKWCNDAGGINGRKVSFNVRDAKLFEYRQRIIEACKQDFFLVGGGGAFDNTGVRDRLKCLLPEFPGQTVSLENSGSDLQIDPTGFNRKIPPYQSYFRWLVTKAHPESASAVGILAGDIGATKTFSQQDKESFAATGAKIVYSDLFPAAGVSDWTPYAQAIKSAGVKGLVYLGDFKALPKLEQTLIDIGYKPVWVDANSNGYNSQFLELSGGTVDQIANYSDPAIYPLEDAAKNPATKQLLDLFKQYAPDADVTYPVVKAWSSWLLFATATRDCGSQVTRKCVYEKAKANPNWDGAGLHGPTEINNPDPRKMCFTAEKASSSGWKAADVQANEAGVYRCENETVNLKGSYPQPTTLADVNMSLDQLK